MEAEQQSSPRRVRASSISSMSQLLLQVRVRRW